jgi:hypothetical protein
MQDIDKALLFLREIREMVFLKKINISKWGNLEIAAKNVGLDIVKLKKDYDGKATELFKEDLKKGRELGVRGFPTIYFTDTVGNTEIVYGAKPYSEFEKALLKINPKATKTKYDKSWTSVFSKYHSLTAKEFSELNSIARNETEKYLDDLTLQGKLEKRTTKNGAIWTIK